MANAAAGPRIKHVEQMNRSNLPCTDCHSQLHERAKYGGIRITARTQQAEQWIIVLDPLAPELYASNQSRAIECLCSAVRAETQNHDPQRLKPGLYRCWVGHEESSQCSASLLISVVPCMKSIQALQHVFLALFFCPIPFRNSAVDIQILVVQNELISVLFQI